MCGIAGFAGEGNVDDLRRMTQALAHRGPDAGGSAVDPDHAVWLGHRRLVVVDPESGDQPMCSADRSVVVAFNGEIYDAPELRKQLEDRGCAFQSHHSDTEILIHGYLEWGPEFVERLNGMWAFALWDRRRRRLLLSRDRFGQKPLYWAQRPGLFAFASELEALAHHTRIERAVSHEALRKFFAYGWVPAPASITTLSVSEQIPVISVKSHSWNSAASYTSGQRTYVSTSRIVWTTEPQQSLSSRSLCAGACSDMTRSTRPPMGGCFLVRKARIVG